MTNDEIWNRVAVLMTQDKVKAWAVIRGALRDFNNADIDAGLDYEEQSPERIAAVVTKIIDGLVKPVDYGSAQSGLTRVHVLRDEFESQGHIEYQKVDGRTDMTKGCWVPGKGDEHLAKEVNQ